MSSVTVSEASHVAVVGLRGEDERSLLDLALLVQLRDELERLNDDQECRCVVLTGGSTFSAGWAPELQAEPALARQAVGSFEWLGELRKPVIAAVQGACHGGGLELALSCDVRLASRDATFGVGESYPAAGGAQRLARVVGRAQALSMLLLGETIDAERAAAIGLVSEMLEDVVAGATRLGETIAARGPIGVHFAKEAVLRGVEMPLEQALRYETDLTIILQATADRAEGVQAFLEKRTPQFRGE
jgi:enoyl-CoA hydratase/carnithine racemase